MSNEFPWVPSYGSAVSTKPNVTVTKFGDGYEMRSALGLNSMPRKWNLTFSRTTADADAIEAFFRVKGARFSFTWTPPRGEAGKWVCREWASQPTSKTTCTITATFEEIFE